MLKNNKNDKNIFAVAFIAITIATAVVAASVTASVSVTLSTCGDNAIVNVEPQNVAVSTGDRFTVNISVDTRGNEVYGAQYTLHFDPSILQVVGQTNGTFLSQDGASTIKVTNRFNNTIGTVEYGETRMEVENGTTVPGVLASITFDVVGTCGSTDLMLSDVILSDPSPQTIPVAVNNGHVTIGFDTGPGTYPSIMGVHRGEFTPHRNITVSRIYTYPCKGTGGHTEYIEIQGGGIDINKTWNGYQSGDYHYITFDEPVILKANTTYNYEIRTGSYPQIHHVPYINNTIGNITCTEFIDANGKRYNDWIPAIALC